VLPDGHDGPHTFTPDAEIIIRFAALTPPTEEDDDVIPDYTQPGA
jgi:hypothetical protein